MKIWAAICFTFLFLYGCVGGTLNDTKEVELYPLRAASDGEAEKLKRSLNGAYEIQETHHKKTGRYYRKTSDMPVDAYCQGIMLAQRGMEDGYEIMAQITTNETTVRWTINSQGVMEEHLEPANDAEIEF